MIPWIEPLATVRLMFLFACTVPNFLSMPTSSIAGSFGESRLNGPPFRLICKKGAWRSSSPAPPSKPALLVAGVVRHVVVHLDGAGDDVGLGLFDGSLHFRRDQRLVVVVERIGNAVLLDAEGKDAGRELVFLGVLEGVVDGQIDALDHGG